MVSKIEVVRCELTRGAGRCRAVLTIALEPSGILLRGYRIMEKPADGDHGAELYLEAPYRKIDDGVGFRLIHLPQKLFAELEREARKAYFSAGGSGFWGEANARQKRQASRGAALACGAGPIASVPCTG